MRVSFLCTGCGYFNRDCTETRMHLHLYRHRVAAQFGRDVAGLRRWGRGWSRTVRFWATVSFWASVFVVMAVVGPALVRLFS